MSVQINRCPVKGRDCSVDALPLATLWPVSSCLPAEPGQSLAPAPLPGGALAGLAEAMPGTIPAAQGTGDCMPEPGLVLHRSADVSMPYPGRAGWGGQVRAVAPFPTSVPSGWIMRCLDLPFQSLWGGMGWDGMGWDGMGWALPKGLRRHFRFSVVQSDLKRKHYVVLNCFHL